MYMKSLLKSFLFIGIFAIVFLNSTSQTASAATSNNCSASYTASGVSFTLAGNPPLAATMPVSLEFASTAQNVGLGQDITLTSTGNGGFQGSTASISSPTSVYYRFMLDGQQYCPPTGVKSLTASTTTTTTTTSGAGTGGSQQCATGQTWDASIGACVALSSGVNVNGNACPSGQTWNPALGICAPMAQTVGGSQTGSGSQGSGQLGGQGEGQLGGQGEGQLGGQGEGQLGAEEENPNNNTTNIRLINPLGGIDSIEGFLEKLFNIVLRIAIPIIALAIIYSGFLFVTAQGKEDKLTTAKNTLMFTLIGAAIILGAWVIANALSETVNDIRNDVGLHSIKDIA
jgi:hypothetical protein